MFKKFDEFVANKNQMKGKDLGPKPKVQHVADFDGKVPTAPPGGGNPYVAKGATKPPAREKGLADKDGGGGHYEPNGKKGKAPGAPFLKTKGKLKGESFFNATSGLSPSKFAEYMTQNKNLGACHEAITSTGRILQDDPAHARSLVREAKRVGAFGPLFQACMELPEAFQELAKLMGSEDGDRISRRLVRALDEAVAPPGTLGGGMMKKKALPPPPPGEEDEFGDMGDEEDPLAGEEGDDEFDPDAEEDPDADLGDDEDLDNPDDYDDGEDDMGDEEDPDADPDAPPDDEEDPYADPLADKGGPPPFPPKKKGGFDGPRASMMHRMMSREHTSPAAKKFIKALKG